MAEADDAIADTIASSGQPSGATIASGDPGLPATATEPLPAVDRDRYTIEGEYARGGIGRILKAYDRRLNRKVAIKELIADTPDLEARFRREALTTARLQHPAIVPVHDAGQWPDGRSFFAMKHVAGRSLDAVVRETETLAQRLALLPHAIAAIDAIAYAHSEQIIHRDIKPANILVGDFGETVVIDWGLAKDLSITGGPDLPVGPYRSSTDSSATVAGAVMGTPAYMPPEQARGEPVDARADVYALGALLYHVLGGAPPFSGPSSDAVLDAVVDGAGRPLDEVEPDLAPELVAIVNRAMARNADERYPTARELAEELRRFQAGKLVGAHRYTWTELVRRWIREHRGFVAAAAVGVVALVALSVLYVRGVVRQSERADTEAARAREETQRTAEANRRLVERTDALTLNIARRLLDEDPTAAVIALRDLSDQGLDGAAWLTAADAVARGRSRVLRGATRQITRLAVAKQGTRATTIEEDGTLRLWDLASGTNVVLGSGVQCSAFTPDGRVFEVTRTEVAIHEQSKRRVLGPLSRSPNPVLFSDKQPVACAAGSDGSLAVGGTPVTWWSADGRESRRFETKSDAPTIALSPDATRVAFQADHQVVLWNPRTNESKRFAAEYPFLGTELRFSPSGRWLAMATVGGKVLRWALAADRPISMAVLDSEFSEITRVAPYDDGRLVAVSSDGVLVRWAADGVLKQLPLGGYGVDVIAGEQLVLVDLKTSLVVIDPETEVRQVLRGHRDWIPAARFLPGDRIISGGVDSTLRIWDPHATTPTTLSAPMFARSPDGRTLAVGGPKGVELIDLATDQRRSLPGVGQAGVVAYSSDGTAIAALGEHGKLLIWPASGGDPRTANETIYPRMLAGLQDGFVAAVTEGVSTISRTGEIRHVCATTGQTAFAFSGDGTRVVSVDLDAKPTRVNDCDVLHDRLRERQGPASVTAVAMSRDGRRLAAGFANGHVRVWTDDTMKQLVAIGEISGLAFSPDGARLAVASEDNTVRVFALEHDEPAVELVGHQAPVSVLAWNDDGSNLLSADNDATLREWDVATRTSRSFLLPESLDAVRYLPSFGVVGSSWSPRLYLWRDMVPRTKAAFRRWLDDSDRAAGR